MDKNKVKLIKKFIVPCPCCDGCDAVGFLGGSISKKYFCRECCVEFIVKGEDIKILEIDTNGVTY